MRLIHRSTQLRGWVCRHICLRYRRRWLLEALPRPRRRTCGLKGRPGRGATRAKRRAIQGLSGLQEEGAILLVQDFLRDLVLVEEDRRRVA